MGTLKNGAPYQEGKSVSWISLDEKKGNLFEKERKKRRRSPVRCRKKKKNENTRCWRVSSPWGNGTVHVRRRGGKSRKKLNQIRPGVGGPLEREGGLSPKKKGKGASFRPSGKRWSLIQGWMSGKKFVVTHRGGGKKGGEKGKSKDADCFLQKGNKKRRFGHGAQALLVGGEKKKEREKKKTVYRLAGHPRGKQCGSEWREKEHCWFNPRGKKKRGVRSSRPLGQSGTIFRRRRVGEKMGFGQEKRRGKGTLNSAGKKRERKTHGAAGRGTKYKPKRGER